MPESDDPLTSAAASPSTTRALVKWWKSFKERGNKSDSQTKPGSARVFGVALQLSLQYASVAISQVGPDGKARIYGHVPIVVAKTGLFLKENGTTTQGVFRVSGSNKRIKELEQIFDNSPSYGKNLIWETYSVHDAGSVLRRYLNMLPEPVIPFELYPSFQNALPRNETGSVSSSQSELDDAVVRYRTLINSLPPASQHIFFYILDLLGVFARKSDQNLMPASNLSMIFQPGLLRHRNNVTPVPGEESDTVKAQIEADSREHKRSQDVLEFLISRQIEFELELPPTVQKRLLSPKRKSAQLPTAILKTPPAPVPVPLANSSPPTSSVAFVPTISESDFSRLKTDNAGLQRRGSDRSDQRRTLRRKKAEAAAMGAEGAVTVKRSKTLPGPRRSLGADQLNQPLRAVSGESSRPLRPMSSNISPSQSPTMLISSPSLKIKAGNESSNEKERNRRWFRYKSPDLKSTGGMSTPPIQQESFVTS